MCNICVFRLREGHTYIYTCTYTIHVHLSSSREQGGANVSRHTYPYIYIYVCVCVCVCVCVYHTHAHTHVHTYTLYTYILTIFLLLYIHTYTHIDTLEQGGASVLRQTSHLTTSFWRMKYPPANQIKDTTLTRRSTPLVNLLRYHVYLTKYPRLTCPLTRSNTVLT